MTKPVIAPEIMPCPTPNGKQYTYKDQIGYANVNPNAGGITKRSLVNIKHLSIGRK